MEAYRAATRVRRAAARLRGEMDLSPTWVRIFLAAGHSRQQAAHMDLQRRLVDVERWRERLLEETQPSVEQRMALDVLELAVTDARLAASGSRPRCWPSSCLT